MNNVFLYTTPHESHAVLAKSINAKFINNSRNGLLKIPFFGKIAQAVFIQKNIPSCDFILCEGSGTDLLAGAIYKTTHPKTKISVILADPKMVIRNKLFFIDKYLFNWALNKTDLFLPITELMKEFLPDKLKKRAHIVNPGINTRPYLKEDANLNKRNLVFVGLLNQHKGLDILFNWFNSIKINFPNTKLFIIGDGPLKQVSKENDSIQFLGKKPSPVTEYSKYASVYINLARIEPAGVAIIEAMCMGLIPIVSEGVGYKEVVKKISPKLIVHNKEELVLALNYIWNDNSSKKTLSKRAKSIGKKYTHENAIKQFKKAYNSCIKS